MLSGIYQHNIDEKGRMFIPSKFRDDLKNRFVITRGIDKCIYIYSSEEWQKISERIEAMPFRTAQQLQHQFYTYAKEVELDKQGRIVLTEALRDLSGIVTSSSVIVIGQQTRCEIWNPEEWQKYNERIEQEDIVAIMENSGF